MKSILFVGMYPNKVAPYRNVFFRNLIYAIADKGIKCTVINPFPITRYLWRTFEIPKKEINVTPAGNKVEVYNPWFVSASSRQIGPFNTEHISEYLFTKAALDVAKSLTKEGKKFDCTYGHFFLYGGLSAICVGKQLGIPSFLAYGECDFESQIGRTYGIPKPEEIEGLKGIISVSTDNTNELNRLGFVNNVPKITVPNATDLTLFVKQDKISCRDKLGIPKDKFIVGFVGGFIDRKGDKRLLEAINRIDGVYGAFAGVGENPPSGERVLFCKALKHEDVSTFLNAIDVFCLPTLSEGSCNAIVEAMACGCPIISSDLPFNDDALNDSNSIRVNPKSVDEIEYAIKKIFNDEDFRNDLSRGALKTSKHFGIEERADNILSFMERLI